MGLKKSMALLCVVSFVTTFAFANGQGESKQAASGKTALSGTLQVWSMLTQKERADQFDKIGQAYEAATPGVKVNITPMPWSGSLDKIMAAVMAGSPPDLSTVGGGWPQTLAGTGGLLEVSDVVDSLGGPDQFLGTSLKVLGRMNGKTYAVPVYVTPYVMYYRKSWLKEAGISKLPTTWEEYYQMCKAVTDPAKNRYGFGIPLADVHGAKTIWSFLLSNGVPLVKQDSNGQWVVDVDRKAAAEVYSFLYKLVRDTSPKGIVSYTQTNVRELVAKGVIMSRIDTPEIYYNVKAMNPDAMDDFGYFRMIPNRSQGAGMGWVGLSIYEKGNTALAKDFVKYMYTGEHMVDFYLSYPYAMFPAKKDVFESKAYQDNLPSVLKPFVPDMALNILSHSAALAMWNGPFPGAGELESRKVLGDALANMLVKGISADQAVDQVISGIKQLLQ